MNVDISKLFMFIISSTLQSRNTIAWYKKCNQISFDYQIFLTTFIVQEWNNIFFSITVD